MKLGLKISEKNFSDGRCFVKQTRKEEALFRNKRRLREPNAAFSSFHGVFVVVEVFEFPECFALVFFSSLDESVVGRNKSPRCQLSQENIISIQTDAFFCSFELNKM